MIDNCFDANATRVIIQTSGRTLTVSDDGKGMKDVRSAVTLGDHKSTGGIGMYGVGLKDAWLSTGDKIRVETRNGKTLQVLEVDVSQLDDDWFGPDPVVTDDDGPAGTSITLFLRKGKKQPRENVVQKMSWLFGPAIEQGNQIIWSLNKKKKPLAPAKLPLMSEVVVDKFDINGKSVEIKIGLLNEGEKIIAGPFWMQYKHRVIESTSIGCNGKSSLGIAGKIILGDGWKFTKNKDSIDDSIDELEDEIFSRISHILDKAESQSFSVETQQLTSGIKSILDDAVDKLKVKEKRGKGKSKGTVNPKGTGRKRRSASKVDKKEPGSVTNEEGETSVANRGFTVSFNHDGEDSLGSYEPRTDTVKLNLENNFISHCRNSNNQLALVCAAVATLAKWQCENPDGNKTLFEVENFGKTFGKILHSIPFDKTATEDEK